MIYPILVLSRHLFVQVTCKSIDCIMFSFVALLVLAWCLPNVSARNETLEHGRVREPSGRGTWSILWSCLSTIFICTWAVLHLDVPKPEHSRHYLYLRKTVSMLIAMIAPEFISKKSAEHYLDAQALSRFLTHRGYLGWTLTHTQFAFATGFHIATPEGETSICSPTELRHLVVTGRLDGPPISADELKSRGGSDSMIKLVAMLQIVWFAVQTLFRAIGHCQVTAIEIMTVGFVFCSTSIYAFCWHQPQNVAYLVVLQIKDVAIISERRVITTNEGAPSEPPLAIDGSKCMRSTSSELVREISRQKASVVIAFFFAIGFGAIQCLAWNSPFPSSNERLAWRICSVASTALPGLMFPQILAESEGNSLVVLVYCLYPIVRLAIIVLAFMSLRALPAGAYETVNWTNYIPHFLA